MGFEQLKVRKDLVQILDSHSITEPTEIQARTFPAAANGHDMVGVSQTGSGKTLAFLLPLLQQVLLTDKPFYTLILAPTRELSLQILDMLRMFESLNIRYSLLLGGEEFSSQVDSINKRPHIVIGTPGRVVKHIQKTKNFHIERIRKLVLDEADRFSETDFSDDLSLIARRLEKKNQTLMFTATLTEKAKSLAGLFMRSPKIIQVSGSESSSTLTDTFALVPEKYKPTVLYNLLKDQASCSVIVFVSLCSTSQRLGQALERLGLSCGFLHGKMPQSRREEIVRSFRAQEIRILVSTDVASRGLDIPHVGMVVNYDCPSLAKVYIHRVGRTARAGKEGAALTLVTQYDVEGLQKLEFVLKRKLKDIKLKLYSDHDRVKEILEECGSDLNHDRNFRR